MSVTKSQEPRKSTQVQPTQLHKEGEATTKPAPNFSLIASALAQPANAPETTKKSGKPAEKQPDKEVAVTPEGPIASGTVSGNQSDAPYGWAYGYDWVETKDEYKITIKVKFNPDAAVTKDEIAAVSTQTSTNFAAHWDNKFTLTNTATKVAKALRAEVVFVDKDPHLTVNLHAGSGHDNLSNWYVSSDGTTRAHELGHQLGLKDEYVDASATDRATATSPGVHTDNSLMGNYYAEGIATAGAKDRHGNFLAGSIGTSSGNALTSAPNTP